MNLIFTLAIATSLTEVSAVSSLRGVAGTFEDQVAVADGYTIHDCTDICKYWWGSSDQKCQNCCEKGKDETGDWYCDPQTLGGACGADCNDDGDCFGGCGECNTFGPLTYAKENTCIADKEHAVLAFEPPSSALRDDSLVTRTEERLLSRGVADTFKDQVAVALGGYQKQEYRPPLVEFTHLTFALEHSKLVLLYFAASWCPMSTPVSVQLDEVFGSSDLVLGPEDNSSEDGTGKTLSIVYVSSDSDQEEYDSYLAGRNWLSVPFSSGQRNDLKRHFATCAYRELEDLGMHREREIPAIIVLDGRSQGVLTTAGVDDLDRLGTGAIDHWLGLRSP